jgi:Ca2+/Na+ antiporter
MKIIYGLIAFILALYIIMVDISSIIGFMYIKFFLILLIFVYIIRLGRIAVALFILFLLYLAIYLPGYFGYVRKSRMTEAIRDIKQMIDAEIAYKTSYGKFYIGKDFNQTIEKLNVKYPCCYSFEYNIKAGETTILIRANEQGKNYYIYGFFPEKNSDKIKGYNSYQDGWDGNIYIMDYLHHSHTDIDLVNDRNISSTY